MVKVIARALAASVLLTSILVTLGSGGAFFYALGTRRSVEIARTFSVVVEPDMGFYVQFGPGYLLGFAAVAAVLTVSLSLLWRTPRPVGTAA